LNRAADALSRMPSSQDLKLDTTDLPTDLQVEALQMAIENIEQEVCNSDEVLDSEVLFCFNPMMSSLLMKHFKN
jgi:hypothetical protein